MKSPRRSSMRTAPWPSKPTRDARTLSTSISSTSAPPFLSHYKGIVVHLSPSLHDSRGSTLHSHLCVQGTAAGGRAGRWTQGWPALAPALSLPSIALARSFGSVVSLPGLLCWFSSLQTISKDCFAQGSVFLFSALLHSLSHSMQPHDLNTLHMLMILRFKFPARTLS